MKKAFYVAALTACVAAAAPFAASAQAAPSLTQAYAQLTQAVKSSSVFALNVNFNLWWKNLRWSFVSDSDSSSGPLTITVHEGQMVHLRLQSFATVEEGEGGSFKVDGITASVNGAAPADGVDVWIATLRGVATVDFMADKPGVYPIYSVYDDHVGQIVVLKP